jgi:hypothetical protein
MLVGNAPGGRRRRSPERASARRKKR